MATQNFDVIVLGNDFAGLVAATLCASRGLRVLLAETEKHRDTYQLGTETLPLAPLFLTGVESPGIARVFEELHFQHLLKRRLETLERGCQLLAPDLRIEADPDRERFSRALRRELGRDDSWLLAADDVLTGFSSLLEIDACMPPTGFWERRELGKLMPRCHSDAQAWTEREHMPASEHLSTLSLLALCGSTAASPIARARAFASTRQSAARMQGDWKTWRSIFLDKFKSHNGEVRRVDAQELTASWGKVTGVACVDDSFTCEYLIASMPAAGVLELGGKKPPKRLAELAQACTPIAYRYTLNLVMQLQGLPEGMAPFACSILDPDAPPSAGGFAILSHRPASQAGRVIVTMQGLTEVDAAGEPVIEGMTKGLLEHAHEVMPFLDDHLQTWDSPHELALDKDARNFVKPMRPEPVWSCSSDETLGLPALPYAAGFKHMCLASAQTLPELGIEGQLIAGWSAAKLATASLGKRKSTSRPTVLADAR